MELIKLPRDVIFQIMIKIPYDKLNRLCNTSKIAQQLCGNEQFWLLKSQHDFNVAVNSKPTTISWKQYYDYLYEINNPKLIGIYLNGKVIDTLEVNAYDKLGTLLLRLRQNTNLGGGLFFYYFVYKTDKIITIDIDYEKYVNKTLQELDLYYGLRSIIIESARNLKNTSDEELIRKITQYSLSSFNRAITAPRYF